MPTYKAPLEDIRFLLHDHLDLARYENLRGFADAPRDIIDAILEEGAKLAEDVLQPLNMSGDQEGCRLENGVVRTPKGFKEAYDTYTQGGWIGLSGEPEYGGQGLPSVLSLAVGELMSSANMAFSMYPGLSHGAYSAIVHHGSPEQKALYLPKLISGEWSGTMNLTEPHCGTDLGLIKTKAVPDGDGSYKITGTKIFISAGEHDLTDNIVHLVLARLPDAPEGVKGISLFIVPKVLINADGSLGARNAVSCGSIEHKMGIHANATCVLNYDGATGWLIGEPHKGLRAMFTMMNEARNGVAMQGLGQSEASYQNAVAYARDRVQGRSLTGTKAPEKPADPIIVHPDVRRMLMAQRALNEGGRALLYFAALQGDIAERSEDEKTRMQADDLMGFLTPVLKAYLTEQGFAACVDAQQVYGGHGYIEENGVEQFVRDARIAMIYEGANGIQALDLVGRKLPANGGRAVFAFFALIDKALKESDGNEALKPWRDGLQAARGDLEAATQWLMANALSNPDEAGGAAMDYLNLTALTALALTWLGIVTTVEAKRSAGGAVSAAFYENKLKTARFFVDRVLPERTTRLARIKSGVSSLLALDADAF